MIDWNELTCDCQRCKIRKKEMDAKIKKIQKKTKSLEKDESKLLKADKKQDAKIAKCNMMMKKKK